MLGLILVQTKSIILLQTRKLQLKSPEGPSISKKLSGQEIVVPIMTLNQKCRIGTIGNRCLTSIKIVQ